MNDPQLSISREQRDQIVKATGAIGRRVHEMVARPTTQADVFVIWTRTANRSLPRRARIRFSSRPPGRMTEVPA